MTDQAMVDHFAEMAKPRLVDLLKLKVRHIYETTPANGNSLLVVEGNEVKFKLYQTSQPYRDIQRFLAEDKLVGFILNPGLLSIAKAVAMDVRGRRLLVTRKIASGPGDKGVVAHIDHFGVRVMMYFDSVPEETQVVWECLYAVA